MCELGAACLARQNEKSGYIAGEVEEDGLMTMILVNAVPHIAPKAELTYGEVVALAGLSGNATVTYRRAAAPRPEGSLRPDQTVTVREGTIINAMYT